VRSRCDCLEFFLKSTRSLWVGVTKSRSLSSYLICRTSTVPEHALLQLTGMANPGQVAEHLLPDSFIQHRDSCIQPRFRLACRLVVGISSRQQRPRCQSTVLHHIPDRNKVRNTARWLITQSAEWTILPLIRCSGKMKSSNAISYSEWLGKAFACDRQRNDQGATNGKTGIGGKKDA
jgi:hypothetical protein